MLIKISEVDFAQPLKPIYLDSRYSSLFLIVYWGYIPLGKLQLYCPSESREFSVDQLKREILQTFGWKLWENQIVDSFVKSSKKDDQSLPPISVVICTRDRPISLSRCLESLKKLDYPNYEVVVVDNCSRDKAVADVVAQSGFCYVYEGTPGLDWARNCGIGATKHGIIAYIDDDAAATRGWLRGIAHGFEDPEVMAVTGMVFPAELETLAQLDFEGYGGMSKGFDPYTIRKNELSRKDLFRSSNWGVGANMAFRRTLFKAIGNFDVALDVGTPTNGGGDIEFFFRTVADGYPLRYEPSAMVYHVHRREESSLEQQIYNNGRSFPAYLLTIARNRPSERIAVLRFALVSWLWEWLLQRLFVSLIKRDRWTFRFALAELRGSFLSIGAYRKSQKVAKRLKEKRK